MPAVSGVSACCRHFFFDAAVKFPIRFASVQQLYLRAVGQQHEVVFYFEAFTVKL